MAALRGMHFPEQQTGKLELKLEMEGANASEHKILWDHQHSRLKRKKTNGKTCVFQVLPTCSILCKPGRLQAEVVPQPFLCWLLSPSHYQLLLFHEKPLTLICNGKWALEPLLGEQAAVGEFEVGSEEQRKH